jgi:hypothetical protein
MAPLENAPLSTLPTADTVSLTHVAPMALPRRVRIEDPVPPTVA